MEKSSHTLHRWKEFTALLTSSSSWCKLYGQMYNLGRCPDFLFFIYIFFFFFYFYFFFFLRKRDAKTTRALPCLVLGSQCWLWDGSSQHCWHVGSDPDQLGGCLRRCSLHSGTWGRGTAWAGSVCAHLATVGTKHHRHCCRCWGDRTPAPEWEQLFGYLLDCQEQEGGGG